MRTPLTLLALLLAGALALTACGSNGSKTSNATSTPKKVSSAPSGSVAQVGDQTISTTRLDGVLATAKAYYKKQKQTFPKQGTAAYAKLRGQAVAFLVQSAIFEQEAQRLGVAVDDKAVSKAVTTLENQQFGGSEKKLRAALAQQGLTWDEFRAQQRTQLDENAIQAKLQNGVKVSDSEAKAYYASHKKAYLSPASRVVRHILVAKKPLADKLYTQLKHGASFAALAKKYSTDTGSKSQGGKLTDTKGSFVPEFEKVAFSLKTGEISKPIRSQYGWHIIQALQPTKPASPQPYENVVTAVKQVLQQTDQQKAIKTFTDTAYKTFCDGRIAYAPGYKPTKATDLCTKVGAAKKS